MPGMRVPTSSSPAAIRTGSNMRRKIGPAQHTATFDATNIASVETFVKDLSAPIDHVMVTAGGPHYGPLLEMDAAEVTRAISAQVVVPRKLLRVRGTLARVAGELIVTVTKTPKVSPSDPPLPCCGAAAARRARQSEGRAAEGRLNVAADPVRVHN